MTIAHRIDNFLTQQAPAAFCDNCLAEKLSLSRRQEVHRATSPLGMTPSFRRAVGVCSVCGETRKVINHA